MERVLSTLGDYFHHNGLKVNVSKFELLTLGSSQNLRSLPPIKISVHGTCVTSSTEVKNLGVIFDQHLSWDAHVRAVSRKCCGILIALSHLRHYLPTDTLPEIVNALVISHIRYCLVVYGNGTTKNLNLIQNILNFAARVISGKRKFDPISNVRKTLGWLDSAQLFQHQSLCLLDKIQFSGQPECIARQICTNHDHPDHVRSTRQDQLLHLPAFNGRAGERRFAYRTLRQRNELPADVRDLRGAAFRRSVKTLLQRGVNDA